MSCLLGFGEMVATLSKTTYWARRMQMAALPEAVSRILQKPKLVYEKISSEDPSQVSFKERLDTFDPSISSLDFATFASLLQWCGHEEALSDGKRVHSLIITTGFEQTMLIVNLLLQMYCKCVALDEAVALFASMHQRNVFSWNLIIRAYARLNQGPEALQLFYDMLQEAVLPSKVTYVSVLDACARQGVLAIAEQAHASIVNSDIEEDVIVGTALVNMYGMCGSLKHALMIFDRMRVKNVVSWTAVIAVCGHHGQGRKALQFFEQMLHEGILPNKITFVSILAACARETTLATIKQLHTCLYNTGFETDVVVGTAVVNMYGKCDNLEHAKMAFDRMPMRNVVAWTAIITVYSQNGQRKQAFDLFDQMQKEKVMPNKATFVSILAACASPMMIFKGKWLHNSIQIRGLESDDIVGTALVNMYGKCGSLEDAQSTFDTLSKRDVISWNAMIALYAEHGQIKTTLALLMQMQKVNMKPNKVTFISILFACASQAALPEGLQLHICIIKAKLELDIVVGNALMSMYGSCASLENAWMIFDKMPERNVVSWTAMIAVYAQHGCGLRALQLFLQMKEGGVIPDQITFINVLAACSHAGLIDEAYDCFVSMVRDYGISPAADHYVCMIDIFGKAGRLDEAETLINDMPFQPLSAPFMTFLSACRCHAHVVRGENAANSVVELDAAAAAPYVMLSNIYASS